MYDDIFIILNLAQKATTSAYIGGFQQVAWGPPMVPEGVPGGPQLNDGELVTKWTLIDL